jgi:hypothetical protein
MRSESVGASDQEAHAKLLAYLKEAVNRVSAQLAAHRAEDLATIATSDRAWHASAERQMVKQLARLHLKYQMASELMQHDKHSVRLWSAVSRAVGTFVARSPRAEATSKLLQSTLEENGLPEDELTSWEMSGAVGVQGLLMSHERNVVVALDRATGDLFKTARSARLEAAANPEHARHPDRDAMLLWIKGPTSAGALNSVAMATEGRGETARATLALTCAAGLPVATLTVGGEENAQSWLSALHACGWSTGALSVGAKMQEEMAEPSAAVEGGVGGPERRSIAGGVAHLTEAHVDEMDLADLKAFTVEHHAALVAERASRRALEARCAELAQRANGAPVRDCGEAGAGEADTSFAAPPPEGGASDDEDSDMSLPPPDLSDSDEEEEVGPLGDGAARRRSSARPARARSGSASKALQIALDAARAQLAERDATITSLRAAAADRATELQR